MERLLKGTFSLLTRCVGYGVAVVVSSAAISGGIITGVLLLAIPLVHADFGEDFVLAIRAAFLYPVVSAVVIYGALYRLGVKSISRSINLLNASVGSHGSVLIRPDVPVSEYPKLLKAVNKIPRVIFITAVHEAMLIVTVLNIYGLYLGFSWDILIWTWIGWAMAMIVYPGPAYFLAEAVTGPVRIQCLRVMWENRIPVERDREDESRIRKKVIVVLLLYLVSLAYTSVLIYVNRENIWAVAPYLAALTAMIFTLMFLLYSGVSRAFRDALDAVRNLARGRDAGLFSPYMDQEFTDLASSINRAAHTISEFRDDLEKQVRARTSELRRKSAIIESELKMAAKVQMGVLEHEPDVWNGLSFAVSYEPMEKVSGDYYEIFRYRDCCFVLLADVSGHGVPAALVTMAAREIFHRGIRPDLEPAYAFSKVNERLLETVTTSEYMTAVLFKVDDKNRVTYTNAAHTRSILYRAREKRFELLHVPGMMLGALPEATGRFRNGELQLQPGDRLHLYTDGIIEQRNESGKEFGMENFLRVLDKEKKRPLGELHERVITALHEYQGDAPVDDDVCFVSVELDARWDKFIKRYEQGVKAVDEQDWHAARAELLRSSALIPSFPPQKYFLARVYLALGELEKALASVEAYLGHVPDDERAHELRRRIREGLPE